ncbi:PREDICTED: beta-carotene hydroxylase 1, chloroplastic-like [Lupinus angustifolius]|uniref:beta-carotene hydroxylase 1, chloroplastic-like n=1 Tax=Lupinus angustifolius TaxID=3871 RepID=UPI00092F7409|nr:PREDICTED: beta-carotene hydroxylase 1, chloroplastic-like [Lupinus angustifolius]
MSSLGITSLAVLSVYYRFSWQMEGGVVPWSEMFGTFALAVGAAVGMEYWARWAHRALWHDSLWHMHEVCLQSFTPLYCFNQFLTNKLASKSKHVC